MSWMRFKVELDKKFGPSERRQIAEDIKNRIIERTIKQNEDKNGDKFPIYTKEYASKKKTSRGNVNLVLKNKMLQALDLISERNGQLLMGYKNGTKENAKAEGNVKGTYGNKSPLPGKQRDFLGLTQDELKQILEKYE